MSPEHAVLGAILTENNVYWLAADVITSEDFASPTLGAIFDGIGRLLAAGKKIEAYTLENYFPEWEIRGVSSDEPWRWVDEGPPWMITELAKRVRTDALRRNGRQVMSRGLEEISDNGKDPALVIEQVNRDLIGRPRTEMKSQSLTEILQTPDTENWVIPDLLEEQDRLILTGHEGLGKTTLGRQLMLLPAAGIHPFTLEQMDPIRSLVIDAENTAKQWMRATRFMVGRATGVRSINPAKNMELVLSGRIDLLDPTKLGSIHRLIDQHKPHLVFLGPLYRLAVQMNTDEQIAPVIAALDTIRDRGVAMIIEAHAGHAIGPGGVRDVRPRGSSALLGWPEFGFGIRKDLDESSGANTFDFVAWRGAREQRAWPEKLIRGERELGDWPWVASTAFDAGTY